MNHSFAEIAKQRTAIKSVNGRSRQLQHWTDHGEKPAVWFGHEEADEIAYRTNDKNVRISKVSRLRANHCVADCILKGCL